MARRGGRRSTPNLKGTNLSREVRTGIYVWRRKDKNTGKRINRTTGTRDLKVALAIAQKFEEEYERTLAGLSKYESYRRPLTDFISPFLASLPGTERYRRQVRTNLLRAFKLLKLGRLADLENHIRVENRLLKLEGTGPGKLNRKTLVRCFQDILKQLSKYLADRREILADHLAPWRRLRQGPPIRAPHAMTPEEFVRALAACDRLDVICRRGYPTRPVFTSMLITAPRASAFAALNVEDLDVRKSRLVMKGHGNKWAGAGALDEKTLAEVMEYMGDRKAGPLFLSSKGGRLNRYRLLDCWKAAASLAAVDLEWPDKEPRDLHLAYLVHLALTSGHVRVALGGPKSGANRPGRAKRQAREGVATRIHRIVSEVRTNWEERMRGVTVHCLRTTHQSWARVSGVPVVLIDLQLGHTTLSAAGSRTGRLHYEDKSFMALDANQSAEAVREKFDEAEAEFRDAARRGETALAGPAERSRQVRASGS